MHTSQPQPVLVVLFLRCQPVKHAFDFAFKHAQCFAHPQILRRVYSLRGDMFASSLPSRHQAHVAASVTSLQRQHQQQQQQQLTSFEWRLLTGSRR